MSPSVIHPVTCTCAVPLSFRAPLPHSPSLPASTAASKYEAQSEPGTATAGRQECKCCFLHLWVRCVAGHLAARVWASACSSVKWEKQLHPPTGSCDDQ